MMNKNGIVREAECVSLRGSERVLGREQVQVTRQVCQADT